MRQNSIFNKPPAYMATPATLSMEEESLQELEDHENILATNQTCSDIDHLVAVADVVEDSVTIVDKTPEIGLTEQSLLDTVSNMVVAGSETAPEDIIPGVSMEDAMVPYGQKQNDDHIHKGGEGNSKETAGSLKEKLAKIWETILKFLAACWEGIKKAASYFYANADKLKRAVAAALQKAQKAGGGEQKAQQFQVTDLWGATLVNGQGFLTESWIEKIMKTGKVTPEEHMNRFFKAVSVLASQVPAQQKKIGEEIKHILDGFDPKNGAGSVSEGVFRLQQQMQLYAKTLVGMGDTPHTNGAETFIGKPLLGNFSLAATGTAANANKNDLWETLDSLNSLRFEIRVPEVKEQGHTYVFHVFPPAASVTELKKYDQIADMLLEFKNKHLIEANASIAEAIKGVSKKISAGGEGTEESIALGKQLLKLNSSYGNWVSQPLLAAMQRICRVCLFYVGVHSKSLSNWG